MAAVPAFILLRTGDSIPTSSLEFSTSRSGGPGGQNVNKVETRVEVRLQVIGSPFLSERAQLRLQEKLASRMDTSGGIRLASSTERSQLGNRRASLARLERLLNGALAPERKRLPTRPTKASRQRRLEAKKRQSAKKRDRGGGLSIG